MIVYKVNIDYIKVDNNWLATFPEIPCVELRGIGTDYATALTALVATFSSYTGYLPQPLSLIRTY